MKQFLQFLLSAWWFTLALIIGTKVVQWSILGESWDSWESVALNIFLTFFLAGGLFHLKIVWNDD